MKTIVCQLWTESEAGWGQRPDGYSLHLNNTQRLQYIKKYNDSLPPRVNGQPPSVYSFADGNGYLVDVEDELFTKIEQSQNGCMFSGRPPKN